MKYDLIVSWPKSCDYPLWRQFIRDNRERFGRVIIIFTETFYGDDYREFIIHAMKEDSVIAIDSPPVRGDQDWRDVAVNTGLQYVTSDWVWFTEEDFLPTDNKFWVEAYTYAKVFPVFGVFEDMRLHPCSLFISKKLLDETPKRFGVLKDQLDHFGQIQRSFESRGITIAKMTPDNYHHMSGLSQNYNLAHRGEVINYKLDEFREYMARCSQVDVPMDSRFIELIRKVIE